jgi:GH25 family lysozyme M1 (1,4-beta-N-acetylmuramidase)
VKRVSRALWKRKLAYRRKRVHYWRVKGNIVKVNRWLELVREAQRALAPPKPKHGIDVSAHNGSVDWVKVRGAGIEFVFVKCSEGEDFVDGSWTGERVKGLRKAGLMFGPYHYLRPRAGRSGAVEARHFVHTAHAAGWGKPGDLRAVLDFEETELSPAQSIRYLKQAVDEVKRLTGKAPIIYTGGPFWNEHGGGRDNWGCSLWLAAYVTDPKSYVPPAWKRWSIWQFTDKGRVAGVVTANVDQNVAHNLPKL